MLKSHYHYLHLSVFMQTDKEELASVLRGGMGERAQEQTTSGGFITPINWHSLTDASWRSWEL